MSKPATTAFSVWTRPDERFCRRIRPADDIFGTHREEQEEGVLNVMDALTEWCHPGARLLPDDPSLSPSGAGAPEKK
jgi:hypothetical protein